MFRREIELKSVIERKSVFLFGPRQTGKSFLLKKLFPDAIYYDLLKTDVFFRLSSNPSRMREEILAQSKEEVIIIDEVQKLPALPVDSGQFCARISGMTAFPEPLVFNLRTQ